MHEIIIIIIPYWYPNTAETHQILQIILKKKRTKKSKKNDEKMHYRCQKNIQKKTKKIIQKKQAYQSNQEGRKSLLLIISNALCYFDEDKDGDNKILKHFSCKICLDLLKGSRSKSGSNLEGRRTERSSKCPKQFRFIRVVS